MKKRTTIKPGDRFGRLTVLEYSHTGKHYRRYFKFACDCGNEITIIAASATSGNTKSCGCLAVEAKKSRAIPNNGGVINHIILQYKRHAKTRGIDWQLDRSAVDRLVRQPCFYCGIAGGNLKKTKNCKEGFAHNGIDRMDSTKAYVIENVVPACGFCNRAKQSMTKEEFLSWINRASSHQKAMSEQWGIL